MQYKKILITGGAGFVGSNLALQLRKKYPKLDIVVLDNLRRRGAELNISRLVDNGIKFIHGDVRNKEDMASVGLFDLMIEASAEPSVLAGVGESPEYLLNTNLVGALHCLEACRSNSADIVFLSTSRVYPISLIDDINTEETESRFEIAARQSLPGVSLQGISELFPTDGVRSLYGATKLSAELMIQEYIAAYNIKGVINRCGLITGPWQMGKIDQGVIVLWLARHIWQDKPLAYIGYGGDGKQVRDFIHVDDLFSVIDLQINDMKNHNGQIYNIGGGRRCSLSLSELTTHCQELSGNQIKIDSVCEMRPNDIKIYISDTSKFQQVTGWECQHTVDSTLTDIYEWIIENKDSLEGILNQ